MLGPLQLDITDSLVIKPWGCFITVEHRPVVLIQSRRTRSTGRLHIRGRRVLALEENHHHDEYCCTSAL